MARSAEVGEMRTRIRVLAPTQNKDAEGYNNSGYANIYPDNRTIRCKWTGAFGTEAVQAQALGLTDTATLTLRYDPRISGDCLITVGEGDSARHYEITSFPNDVGGQHKWLELRIKRRTKAI